MAALAAVGTPLPALPPATTELLLRALPTAPQLLTPAWLRDHLRARATTVSPPAAAAVGNSAHSSGDTGGSGSSSGSGRGSVAAAAGSAPLSMPHATALLRYAIADIDDSDAEMVCELAGLPLLPVATGGLATLQLDAAVDAAPEAGVGGGSGRRSSGMVYLVAPGDEVLLAAAPWLLLDQAAAGTELTAR